MPRSTATTVAQYLDLAHPVTYNGHPFLYAALAAQKNHNAPAGSKSRATSRAKSQPR